MASFLSKVKMALASRTVGIIVLFLFINVVPQVRLMVPPQYLAIVDALLGLAATYFHVNPSQNYSEVHPDFVVKAVDGPAK